MATFFKKTRLWVIDYRYDGRERRWLKALPEGSDSRAETERLLADLYGNRARLVELRPATPEEETAYLRGEQPRNLYCPSGKLPLSSPVEPGPVSDPTGGTRRR